MVRSRGYRPLQVGKAEGVAVVAINLPTESSSPPNGGFLMLLPRMGDSFLSQFSDGMCIGGKCFDLTHNQLRPTLLLNPTQPHTLHPVSNGGVFHWNIAGVLSLLSDLHLNFTRNHPGFHQNVTSGSPKAQSSSSHRDQLDCSLLLNQ